MRRIVTSMILSFILLSGSGVAFAQHGHDRGGRDRQEQRDRGRRDHRDRDRNHHKGMNHSKPRPGGDKNYKDKHHHNKPGHGHNGGYGRPVRPGGVPAYGHGRPHGNGHYSGKHHGRPIRYRHRPTPPPPRHHYHHGPMHPPVNLGHMVAYLTRGCSDVAVWQIDYDTYIVKYRRGNRLYTQHFYPYYDEYASPSRISVGWRPSSPWNLIPSINLNINI